MEWFSQNWVWVLFAVGMIAMHMFGHGGHGGHGGHCGHAGGHADPEPAGRDPALRNSDQNRGHQH